VKSIRVLSRIALLSLAAAGFVKLTAIFGDWVRPSLPNPGWQATRRHRPSPPKVGYVSEFFGEGMVLVIYGVAGRLVFQLRLSPVSRAKGQPILLDLHRTRQDCQNTRDPEVAQDIQP
jgi:hypothetical protein